jgi:Rps23 Pro-64 3,4-dihydroxylase Tpa1-like proline 4-hydroxylase
MVPAMLQDRKLADRERGPALNPELDRALLAAEFARRGHVQIPQLLDRESAQRVYACLTEETPFSLIFNDGEKQLEYHDLTAQQRQDFTRAAWRRVGLRTFQFLYEQHILTLDGQTYADRDHYWARVTDFLNGPEFLELVREITGMPAIDFADAQASVYRAGHFLTSHGDESATAKRQAAYVLGMTPSWRPEWGGLLEFIGQDGHIESGYVPNFNSLRLFRVPINHYVSCVAPYAMTGRYSVTGWLRAR